MWNFSFDDLARRAQEEAAKLAEQAQDVAANMQSPSLFNLDSMNPETAGQNNTRQPPSTVQPASLFDSFSSNKADSNLNTAPPAYTSRTVSTDEGNADHVSSLVNNVASPRAFSSASETIFNAKKSDVSPKKKEKVTVTKLSTVSASGTDDFFDSWGDGAAADTSDATTKVKESNVVGSKTEEVQPTYTESVDADNQGEEQPVMEDDAWNDDFDVPDNDEQQMPENIDNGTCDTAEKIEDQLLPEANAWNDDLDIPDEEEAVDQSPETSNEVVARPTAQEEDANLEVNALGDNFDMADSNELGENQDDSISGKGASQDDNERVSIHRDNIEDRLNEAAVEDAWNDDLDIPDDTSETEELNETQHLSNPEVNTVETSNEVFENDLCNDGFDVPADISPNVKAEVEDPQQIDAKNSQHTAEDETATVVKNVLDGELNIDKDTNLVGETSTTNIEQVEVVETSGSTFDPTTPIAAERPSEKCVDAEADDNRETEYLHTHAVAAGKGNAVTNESDLGVIHAEESSQAPTNLPNANPLINSQEEKEEPDQEEVDPWADDVDIADSPSVDEDANKSRDFVGETCHNENGAKAISVKDSNEPDRMKVDDSAGIDSPTDNDGDVWAEDDLDVAACESDEAVDANLEPSVSLPQDGGGVDEVDKTTELSPSRDNYQPQQVTDIVEPATNQLEKATASTLFDGAPDISAATQSLQSAFESHASNLFDASKSSTMFGWSFQGTRASDDAGSPTKGSPPNATSLPSSTEGSAQPLAKETANDANAMDLYNDDALDDMYDDDSSDEEGADSPVSNEANLAVDKKPNEKLTDSNGRVSPETLPPHAVEKFVKQLERMTESHQLEMDELHRTYKIEITQLQKELEDERTEKKKVKAREVVAAQDKHLSQMRELEKTLNKTLQEKEDNLEEVMKRNEGFTLKMDSMKREVDGLLKLVDERDDEIARLKRGHGNTMLKVEGSIKDSQQELCRKDAEIKELKSSISSIQAELDSTTEHYNTLKSRAKSVATELKDRRIEVRTLNSQNEELTTANATLETELANAKSQNTQQQRTIDYKDKDIETLNEKIKALMKEMNAKDSLLQDRSSVGEKAISSYKRKAQEALAAANSRLAAANQAREEAESDAKAAKAASDDAVERARVAEAKRVDAERSASKAIELLEAEKNSNAQALSDLQQTVDEMKDTLETLRSELDDAESSKETLHFELDRTKAQLNEQKELNSELRQNLLEAKDLCNSLQEEVHNLRDEAQRSSAAAFKRQKDESSNAEGLNDEYKTGSDCRVESDGTIIMLQQELQGANDAIAELKLALRMALLEKAESSSVEMKQDTTSTPADQDHHRNEASQGNDSTPLFFAIEKQNELNTARDEINRLANMLGDAESEKQEAFDAMEKMRQEMEQANARLQRYEKLGMKSTGPPRNPATSVGYSSFRGGHSNGAVSRENDSAVNLEYLKNVMLSYLNAKTLAERRKLVPVVATVLCLTPEEHSKAVKSVEESAGLTGVASSFWENLESKAHNLM